MHDTHRLHTIACIEISTHACVNEHLTPTHQPTYTLLDKGWPGASMGPWMERWTRGREGGVEGGSGEKSERRDEIEGHLPRC